MFQTAILQNTLEQLAASEIRLKEFSLCFFMNPNSYKVQWHIQNPVKYLRWRFCEKKIDIWKLFNNFVKSSILDVSLCSEYTSEKFKLTFFSLQFSNASIILRRFLRPCDNIFVAALLSHLMSLVYFYAPWKHRKTRGFLRFQRVYKETTGM